jgi:hypothetical protein
MPTSTRDSAISTRAGEQGAVPRCRDFDEDCADIGDGNGFDSHLDCWLYDPAKGHCPFLRAVSADWIWPSHPPSSRR